MLLVLCGGLPTALPRAGSALPCLHVSATPAPPCSYLYLRSAKVPAPSPCGCGRHHGASEDEPAAGSSGGQAADGRAAFDRLADAYDSLIAADETFMGLKLMRRWLMRHAEVCGRAGWQERTHAQSACGCPSHSSDNPGGFGLPAAAAGPPSCASGLSLGPWFLPIHPASPPPCTPTLLLQGDVLEVSAGTGRNLPYYPLGRMRSLTLTDTSRPMLVNAADKYAAMVEKGGAPAATLVRFELADAQQLVAKADGSQASSSSSSSSSSSGSSSAAAASGEAAAPDTPRQQGEGAAAAAAPARPARPPLKEQQTFAPNSFDVVVDTFGLCSQADPVTALKVGSALGSTHAAGRVSHSVSFAAWRHCAVC